MGDIVLFQRLVVGRAVDHFRASNIAVLAIKWTRNARATSLSSIGVWEEVHEREH
jgi:hypothetical protein